MYMPILIHVGKSGGRVGSLNAAHVLASGSNQRHTKSKIDCGVGSGRDERHDLIFFLVLVVAVVGVINELADLHY